MVGSWTVVILQIVICILSTQTPALSICLLSGKFVSTRAVKVEQSILSICKNLRVHVSNYLNLEVMY